MKKLYYKKLYFCLAAFTAFEHYQNSIFLVGQLGVQYLLCLEGYQVTNKIKVNANIVGVVGVVEVVVVEIVESRERGH